MISNIYVCVCVCICYIYLKWSFYSANVCQVFRYWFTPPPCPPCPLSIKDLFIKKYIFFGFFVFIRFQWKWCFLNCFGYCLYGVMLIYVCDGQSEPAFSRTINISLCLALVIHQPLLLLNQPTLYVLCKP